MLFRSQLQPPPPQLQPQLQPPPPQLQPQLQPPPQNRKKVINNHTTDFWVMADIQNDVYRLYSSNDTDSYVGIVYIPNYNTSVYMNSLFRNIRENINLDYLEESDDEIDFEDTRPDKYVDLKKRIRLSCVYNKKFRKWVPYQDKVV